MARVRLKAYVADRRRQEGGREEGRERGREGGGRMVSCVSLSKMRLVFRQWLLFVSDKLLFVRQTVRCSTNCSVFDTILVVATCFFQFSFSLTMVLFFTSNNLKPQGSQALQEVAMELEVLTSQLEYERQVQRLINAMNTGAVLSCDLDCSTIQVSGLTSAIQDASACGYEAPVSLSPSDV